MTATEQYTKMIEDTDRHLKSDEADIIKSLDAATRANVGAHFLNEALNNNIPIAATSCNIARKLWPEVKDREAQLTMGWSVLRPLVVAGIVNRERESVRSSVKGSSTARANLFKKWQDSKQNSKKSGDWTSVMFKTSESKKAQDFLWKLFTEYDAPLAEEDRNKIYNYQPKEWTSLYHNDDENGVSFGKLITRANKRVKEHFHGRKIKPVLDAVNKLQSTTFLINESVLERLEMDSKAIVDSILESAETNESGKSKKYEFTQVITKARENVGKEVYSSIYLDTRGRTYYGANYLNRSGNDYAKAVLMVTPEEIGLDGWDALLIAAVDFRAKSDSVLGAQEKLSRAQKLEIANEDLEEFLAVANGASYMDAEEKAQYLAVCIDIRNADQMGSDFTKYKSGTLLSRDASQSGPMLMGIATQDENTMKYTNVMESDERHDLYEALGADMLKLLHNFDAVDYDGSLDGAEIETVNDVYTHSGAMLNAKCKMDFIKYFAENPTMVRKWSKYPLMLFGYSAEQWCIANDLWDKFQHKADWLTPVHTKFLADLYYEAAKTTIPAVYQFMEGLKELGRLVHSRKEDVLVHAAYSNFPFMQNYFNKETVKVQLMGLRPADNGGKKDKFTLCLQVETESRNYHKTRSGTPANSVHSIDSDLLKMVVNKFPHDMATNHDAFFATPARIGELDVVLRECTLSLGTEYDLLGNITKNYNLNPEDLGIKINPIHPQFNPINNEYCYS